jgi:hypothetical protein
LFKTEKGRTCKEHPNGCGVTLKVGDIIKFKKESLEFTEEAFTASRHEEIQALLKKDLILICKNNEIKFKSSDKKNELIDYILLHEGEEFGEREQQIEIKQWTEKALKAVLLDTGCTVGFLGEHSFDYMKVNWMINMPKYSH